MSYDSRCYTTSRDATSMPHSNLHNAKKFLRRISSRTPAGWSGCPSRKHLSRFPSPGLGSAWGGRVLDVLREAVHTTIATHEVDSFWRPQCRRLSLHLHPSIDANSAKPREYRSRSPWGNFKKTSSRTSRKATSVCPAIISPESRSISGSSVVMATSSNEKSI